MRPIFFIQVYKKDEGEFETDEGGPEKHFLFGLTCIGLHMKFWYFSHMLKKP